MTTAPDTTAAADIDYGHVPCPVCYGECEVLHPAWGTRGCPEPTVECAFCGGDGEVTAGRAAAYRDTLEAQQTAYGTWPAPPAGAEEPF